MKPLILGSQSPRRKHILNFFKLPFIQVTPLFDEDKAPIMEDPILYAHSLSRGKALSLKDKYKDHLILSADTIVYKEGQYFGKPASREEAEKTLKTLLNGYHQVITSLTLISDEEIFQDYGETKVLFNDLNERDISKFLNTDEWADKAGGYGIQGGSSLLVKKIEGCFYNVMGLPIQPLFKLLKKAGIDLWDFI